VNNIPFSIMVSMGSCLSSAPVIQPTEPDQRELELLNAATDNNTPDLTYDFTKAKVLRVYDGDTFYIAAVYAGKVFKFPVRLFGVDTPEMKGGTNESKLAAKEAKEFVERFVCDKIIDIHILNNRLHDGKIIKEKFGRLLAVVKVGGVNLADELIRLGYAVPYFGGTKGDK